MYSVHCHLFWKSLCSILAVCFVQIQIAFSITDRNNSENLEDKPTTKSAKLTNHTTSSTRKSIKFPRYLPRAASKCLLLTTRALPSPPPTPRSPRCGKAASLARPPWRRAWPLRTRLPTRGTGSLDPLDTSTCSSSVVTCRLRLRLRVENSWRNSRKTML